MSKDKISTQGGADLGQNPFGALSAAGLPSGPVASPVTPSAGVPKPVKNRGRVDLLRSTAGRGGKTVTVIQGFTGIGLPEKEELLKKIQKACGCGGTIKDGAIEVQGDRREAAAKVLADAGFRPVMAGG